jgi:hypothetical protein
VEKSELGGCEIFKIKLKSQVWQGIPWEHDLVLFRPKEGDVARTKDVPPQQWRKT